MKRAILIVLASVLAASGSASAQPEAVVSSTSFAPTTRRLPILGASLDAGLPDGLMGSVTVRPLTWLRASLGAGSNGISAGFRAGLTLLPFGVGPSASLEYGRYLEGNANRMSQAVLGKSSALLDRVGYQFANAHLGVDFGLRRCVFFIHGGVSVVRGTIHNLDRCQRACPGGHHQPVAGGPYGHRAADRRDPARPGLDPGPDPDPLGADRLFDVTTAEPGWGGAGAGGGRKDLSGGA